MFGRDKEEHNARLIAALNRIRDAGVALNREKCEFEKGKLLFLGHVIDQHGVQVDPEKTSAIEGLSSPSNVTELRRFLGMANQMGKFSPNLAQVTQSLRLSKNRTWQWGLCLRRSLCSGYSRALQTNNACLLYPRCTNQTFCRCIIA